MDLTEAEYAELDRLSTAAFDRSLPGSDRSPMLARLKELIEKTGSSCVITFYWTGSDGPSTRIDPIQDEIDRIRFEELLRR